MQFVEIAAIAVICLLIGQGVKVFFPNLATNKVPWIVGISGGILGLIGSFTGLPLLVGLHPFDAFATGVISSSAASGIFSWYKNATGQYDGNDGLPTTDFMTNIDLR